MVVLKSHLYNGGCMKRFIAEFTQEIEIDKVLYQKGDQITLDEAQEYPHAYWIVRLGVPSRDLLTNQFGKLFDLVKELEIAA